MRLEIDGTLINQVQKRYVGAQTTATGLVTWLLQCIVDGRIDRVPSAISPEEGAGGRAEHAAVGTGEHRGSESW
jgi:hypothetical protein